jgi:calcium/calmodulin-dependent protein kinase I
MHEHGICHRDLKPHNILCVESSMCAQFIQFQDQLLLKITDFNVSKFIEDYKEVSELNQLIEMWTYTGTVAFSAPEILSGEGYK